jgi:hypothetical protein
MGISRIMCYGDSDLVAQQVSGTCDAKDTNMAAYKATADKMAQSFVGYKVHHIKWADNNAADALSHLGSSRKAVPPEIFLEHLHTPSVKGVDAHHPESSDSPLQVMVITPDWTVPFLDFLVDGELPEDETEARRLSRRVKGYTVINGQLYKRSTTGVFQRCVDPEEGRMILEEIHSGDCGHHQGSRALVAKAFRHGFYWLTAKADAEEIVNKCKGCQLYARQAHLPATDLQPIPITWPFAVWCLDMVGPLKRAPSGFTHLLVAVDKFTKWIEAKPIAKCDGKTARKFMADIVVRFGVPHSIITDNGSNLSLGALRKYCDENGIWLDLASVAHPQSNGQVERSNGLILQGLKPRLEAPLHRAAGAWAEELPSVL